MFRWAFILNFKALFYCSLLFLGACSQQGGANENIISKPTKSTVEKIHEKDLWRYIANRYTLKKPNQKHLYWHIDWFKKNPDYLTRVTKRAQPYLFLVTQEVEKAGLPIEIALLPIVESAYYPFSYSHGSASGLWQFIPSTGKLYGLEQNWWYDARRDVLASTRAAVKYLKNLNKLFKGDWLLAIAAYNSGPGRVQKAIKKNKKQGKKTDFWHLDLPKETRGYVPRLLAVSELIKFPEKYGQTITSVSNQHQLDVVSLDSQFDLATISSWSGLDLEEIYNLNPGLKRWATPAGNPYQLLLPLSNSAIFKEQVSNNPIQDRVKWVRHKIKKGESLGGIAKQFKTTIEQIQSINHLSTSVIKAGDYLIVPVSQRSDNSYLLSDTEREKQRLIAKKTDKKIIHQVSSGESLWLIANRYNVSVNQIIRWNHLDRSKPLTLGKKLVLWQPTTPKDKDLSALTTVGIDIDRTVIYTVKSGDYLSKIAKRFDVSVSQIIKWNQLDKNNHLKIGQKLKIIVNVVNSKMK